MASFMVTGCVYPPHQQTTAEAVALYGQTEAILVGDPSKVVAIYSYDSEGRRKYFRRGVDYVTSATGIARLQGSEIFDFNSYAVNLRTDGKYDLVLAAPRNPPLVMNHLAYVEFEPAPVAGTLAGLAPHALTGRLMTAGDSITGGAHTIAREHFDSDADGYVGLLRSQLAGQLSVENFSFNGSSIGTLTNELPTILSDPPDVLLVAFGQNDHASGPAGLASFEAALNDIADDAQAAGVYVVFVGFMPKNPMWSGFSQANADAYNAAIENVAASHGAPFVDIAEAWRQARLHKSHIELTGDNHHHPNNYGARVWFSAILPHLIYGTIAKSDVHALLEF